MHYPRLKIHFGAWELLSAHDIGPLWTDEMHTVRMRADAGETYEEMHLKAAQDDQERLADAYAENLTVAALAITERLNQPCAVALQESHETEHMPDPPATISVEDAIKALAMARVEVRWHVPEGHTAGGWAIFRDGMLVFEL